MPGYATIGIVAPLLVVIGRLLQGFSAGVELGGVSVYLSEIATPGHKGFYVSWQSASQQCAVVFAAILGVSLSSRLSPPQMTQWGWRVPLLVGCLIIPFLFLLRSSLAETDDFLTRQRPTMPEILRSLRDHWSTVLLGMMLVTMTTVSFYMITAYTPTFGQTTLRLSSSDSLIVTLCVGVSNLFWLPVMGALSDRVGRRPLLLTCTVLALLTAYPALLWLVSGPSFARLLTVELWLSFLYGSYNGAMVVYPHRDHARERARHRILACLQPGDSDFRRLHAGDLHVPDPRDWQSSRAWFVGLLRGGVRLDGNARAAVWAEATVRM